MKCCAACEELSKNHDDWRWPKIKLVEITHLSLPRVLDQDWTKLDRSRLAPSLNDHRLITKWPSNDHCNDRWNDRQTTRKRPLDDLNRVRESHYVTNVLSLSWIKERGILRDSISDSEHYNTISSLDFFIRRTLFFGRKRRKERVLSATISFHPANSPTIHDKLQRSSINKFRPTHNLTNTCKRERESPESQPVSRNSPLKWVSSFGKKLHRYVSAVWFELETSKVISF